MYQKQTLSNGVRLITAPMPQVKSVAALVMVEAGSRYETPENNGISHFVEHTVFKGTKKRPSSLLINSLIDSIGGAFNAFTGKETTGFYIKAEASHLNFILDILSDVLLHPLFDPAELDRERLVITEEINMYEDQPQARVGELFEELLYLGSPLAMRIIGNKTNLKKITREQIFQYLSQMYHTKSLVVGLAGQLPANHETIVSNYFGTVLKGPENQYSEARTEQNKPSSLVYYKKTDQAHLALGVRAYSLTHPDRYALAVLSTILGGNMSSRLFYEVREKRGLAYYVGSGSEEFHDTGYFSTQAGLRLDAVEEAIKVILEQYHAVSANKVTAEELKRAKDYWKGRMVLALEDSLSVARYYTSQELMEKKIETPDEVLSKVDAITADDIQRVAKDIFKHQKLNLAVVGPFKNQGKFDRILKLP